MEKTLRQRMQDHSQEVRRAAIAERDKIFTDEGAKLRKHIEDGNLSHSNPVSEEREMLEGRIRAWFDICQCLCYFHGPGHERELGDKHAVAMVKLLTKRCLKRLIPPFANWKIGVTQ